MFNHRKCLNCRQKQQKRRLQRNYKLGSLCNREISEFKEIKEKNIRKKQAKKKEKK